jgi:outer membrane lipoprotein-sorting protein
MQHRPNVARTGIELMSRRRFLGTAAAGLALAALGQFAGPLVGAARAQAPAATAQSIANHFANVRTMMGEFVQFGPRGEQTGGKFYIERPGKVRFNYDPPSNFRVMSDGQTVVLENTKLRTADVYPLSKTPLKLLLDDSIDLSGDKVKSVKEEADLTTIKLADRSLFGDSTITLMFDPKSFELRQWTITDAQGKDTTVMIFNVEQGVTFDPSVFAIDHQRIQKMTQENRNQGR